MKAATSLLAVLLMLSCTSLAQTAPVQPTAPTQQTAPVQQAAPVQETAPAELTTPNQTTPAGGESSKPEAASQQTTPDQTTAPTQQAVAGGESAKPEAESEASTTAVTPSTEAPAANAGAVRAASLAPGAKLFLEPMGGFEQFLSASIAKKKVPVVFVNERAMADFLVSGGARVKKPGWITGMVLGTKGGANVSVNDARKGNLVFACQLNRADEGLSEYYQYRKWADQCAESLHKAMKKR